MRIISRKTLRLFWQRPGRQDAQHPLEAWFHEVARADWANPTQVKAAFGNASIIGDNRVVFNIAGNKYRMVVKINYPYRVLYIRFIGTHREYDTIDAEDI
jgi:mRNA interferase HigB